MSKQKPVHEIKLGACKCAIWANHTSVGTRHNATFSRIYKDADDKWCESYSYGRDHLHLVAMLAEKAETWIYENGGASTDTNEEVDTHDDSENEQE